MEVRLYDRLFRVERPGVGVEDFTEHLNPDSLEILSGARLEPAVAAASPGSRFQFERQGYFHLDPTISTPERPVYNRIVTLKDAWARLSRSEDEPGATAASTSKATAAEAPRGKPARKKSKKQAPQRQLPPELVARGDRYRDELGIAEQDARVLTQDSALADFFDAARPIAGDPAATARWIVNELLAQLKDRPVAQLPFDGAAFGGLVALVGAGTISGRTGKAVLETMLAGGGSAAAIVDREGLAQIDSADQLEPVISQTVADHPAQLAAYRAGKQNLFGFFVGQVMKATGGRANPKLANQILRRILDS